ncbi:MAG TPA: C25 family peptidase propeptide domain-containing protein, partial [Candidatus Kapabacteria bacterium]|nr:C25 family peptidase propeptide domain-containing protein [Candidatus Kapabacteria bacterium]
MRSFLSTFLSLLICFTAALPLCAQPHTIHAVTSGGTIQLQIPNLHYDFRTINVKGTKFIKPEILNAAEATRQPHVGAPDIPYLTTLIALPSEALPTIEITDQQSYVRTQQNIYIAQAVDQSSLSQKNISGSAHTASVSNASQLIVLGKPEIMRGMYVVPVRINPLQFNPATGELRVYTSIKFSLHTSGFKATVNRVPLAGSASESNAWEQYARPMIANYRDALQWRTIPLRKSTAAPARMMLSPGQQRVKMFVNRNGIYRITGNDLNAIGAPLASMDPRTFHVYCFHNVTPSIPFMPDTGATPLPPYQADTIEVPLYLTGAADGSFDAGDTLQFYGKMHYGEEGDFYDDFTDDNVYWLTWGGSTNQELYTARTQLPSAPKQDWSVKSDHYEKDVNYFLGDNVKGDYGTIYVADKVPGERFYWQTLDPNSQSTAFNQSFTIGGLPDAQGNATLRIHMRGISGDSAFLPDHNIEIFLNFDSVAFVQFNEWQDTIVTLTFPCKKLRNGKNDLSLLSLPPAGSAPGNYVDQVAVDFYEVITPQQYVFSGDSLEFNAPAGGVSQFTLQNARSPQMTVY